MLKDIHLMDLENADIRTLKNAANIKIDDSKPVMQRLLTFIDQMGSPYLFRVVETPVNVVFLKRHAQTSIEVGLEKIVRSIAIILAKGDLIFDG